MFGLFASAKTKAMRGASQALQSMMEALQTNGKPQVPAEMWHDPYILGFTFNLIGLIAKEVSGDKINGRDFGEVISHTYSSISNADGPNIADRASDLALAKDREFQRGSYAASSVFWELEKGRSQFPLVRQISRIADAIGKDKDRVDFQCFVVVKAWNKEVDRISSKSK